MHVDARLHAAFFATRSLPACAAIRLLPRSDSSGVQTNFLNVPVGADSRSHGMEESEAKSTAEGETDARTAQTTMREQMVTNTR